MEKVPTYLQKNDHYEHAKILHVSKVQAFIAIVTVVIMLSAFITKSIWGASAMSSELDADHKALVELAGRIGKLENNAGQIDRLESTIQTLNENITNLSDQVNAMRNDWQDLWKNYNIPKKR